MVLSGILNKDKNDSLSSNHKFCIQLSFLVFMSMTLDYPFTILYTIENGDSHQRISDISIVLTSFTNEVSEQNVNQSWRLQSFKLEDIVNGLLQVLFSYVNIWKVFAYIRFVI